MKKSKSTGERKMFQKIYDERKHVSGITGDNLDAWLGSYAALNCYAHIIPKNGCNQLVFPSQSLKDEMLRLNPANVMLMSPEEHRLLDLGTEAQRARYEAQHRCSFKVFYAAKQKLIEDIKLELKMMGY